jgi:EmrB/QacA subfamily drug resistance transporter
VQWVLNGYALVFGGLLLLCGRLGDLYGRRLLFGTGLVVFLVGSLVAGMAAGPGLLVVARGVQGAGAAGFVPASLALLTLSYDPDDHAGRSRAVGAYGAAAAAGFVVGMVGGGVITELWGWRWVFFVNVPVAAALLLAAWLVLPESRGDRVRTRLDLLGAVTVTAGLVLVIYAMTSVPDAGLSSWRILGPGAAGVLVLACFVLLESRHPAPLVPLHTLRRTAVLVPNAAVALLSMIGIGWLYVLTLYFQEVLHRGPLQAGLLFAPMTVSSVVASPVAGRMAGRVGVRRTATTGLVLLGAGLVAMTAGVRPEGSLPPVMVGTVVGEFGFMLASVALTLAGTRALRAHESGLAAGLLNTSIQLGSGWGLGMVAVVVAAGLRADATEIHYAGALRSGLLACLGFCAVAMVLVLHRLHRAPRRPGRSG